MIRSWSPSRLSNWEECSRRAKYQIVDKLCPACFLGRLAGPWGMPATCNQCGKQDITPAAIARGVTLHTLCETFITRGGVVPVELTNVAKTLKRFRTLYKRGALTIEADLVFMSGWELTSKFHKDAWLRTKLDVLVINGKKAKVVDWKSGGIDKRTGLIRENEKYADQLQIYSAAVLVAYPEIEQVESSLIFIDAPEGANEVVQGGLMTKSALPGFKKKWSQRSAGMLADQIFAARPGFHCRFCAFSKTKGGPCSF